MTSLRDIQRMSAEAVGAAAGSRQERVAKLAAEATIRAWNPSTMAACGKLSGERRSHWERQEFQRLKREVTASVREEYPVRFFDPFSWVTVISIIVSVIRMIMDWWNRDSTAEESIESVRVSMGIQ